MYCASESCQLYLANWNVQIPKRCGLCPQAKG